MRFEHGSHRTECLAALIAALLLLLQPRRARCAADCRPSPLGADPQCLPADDCGPLTFCAAHRPACDPDLRRRDQDARRAADAFAHLLRRFDCENANSVSWTCRDCQEAYKQWVCAMFLPPARVEGEPEGLKPCRYVCRLVEQRCPYFHPSVKEQYAGERVFKCIDPDIPDLESIQADSSYGPPHRCYCPHHLEPGGGEPGPEPECRLLSPAQLRRNASRWGHHHRGAGSGAPGPPRPAWALLLAAALLAWWTTRTR